MSEAVREGDGLIAEESSSLARKIQIIAVAVALVGALGYFAVQAFQGATVYYYTPSEVVQLGPTEEGKMVRVSGKLVPDTFARADGSTLAHFELTDGSENVPAAHNGVLPDLFFNDHSEIILEGSLGNDGVFESQNVIVKCPSKYVGEEGPLPEDHRSQQPTG